MECLLIAQPKQKDSTLGVTRRYLIEQQLKRFHQGTLERRWPARAIGGIPCSHNAQLPKVQTSTASTIRDVSNFFKADNEASKGIKPLLEQ